MKYALLVLLSIAMIVAGCLHFKVPQAYVKMMPAFLPAHLPLVYVSGVAEILCGLGLLLPQTRVLSAWALIALLIAVFPANVNMAVHHIGIGDRPPVPWMLWARLPVQGVLIAWAYWFT